MIKSPAIRLAISITPIIVWAIAEILNAIPDDNDWSTMIFAYSIFVAVALFMTLRVQNATQKKQAIALWLLILTYSVFRAIRYIVMVISLGSANW